LQSVAAKEAAAKAKEAEAQRVEAQRIAQLAAAKKAQPESSSDSSDSNSSESEDSSEKPAKKVATTQPVKKAGSSSSDSGDSDSSDSDDSFDVKVKPEAAKPAVAAPKTAVVAPKTAVVAPKKTDSSSSDTSDSDSSSEDSETSSSENVGKRKAEVPAPGEPASKKGKMDVDSPQQNGGNQLYVGNLNYKITDENITSFFEDCGKIDKIQWVEREGRFSGAGFVTFDSAETATKALAKSGQDLLGRPVKVDLSVPRGRGDQSPGGRGAGRGAGRGGGRGDQSPGGRGRGDRTPTPKTPGSKTVFVGNLPYNIDEEALKKHFASCGPISAVRWVQREGEFRGVGFVEFENTDSTDKAVALAGSQIAGRSIRVDHSTTKG